MRIEHYSDVDWLRLAFRTAAEHSEDNSTQNGAVVVPQRGYVMSAANRFPDGVQARYSVPAKYDFIEHAERAAIYSAARAGVATLGGTLYCCWFACPDCARAIIESGIKMVVGHLTVRNRTPRRWAARIELGEQILREGDVSMQWLTTRMGVEIMFNGEMLKC